MPRPGARKAATTRKSIRKSCRKSSKRTTRPTRLRWKEFPSPRKNTTRGASPSPRKPQKNRSDGLKSQGSGLNTWTAIPAALRSSGFAGGRSVALAPPFEGIELVERDADLFFPAPDRMAAAQNLIGLDDERKRRRQSDRTGYLNPRTARGEG